LVCPSIMPSPRLKPPLTIPRRARRPKSRNVRFGPKTDIRSAIRLPRRLYAALAYRLIFLRRQRIEFPQFLSKPAALWRARSTLLLEARTAIVLLLRTAGLPEIVRSLAARSAQLPTLDRHLTPDIVRCEQTLHHAAVTCRLLRGNLERDGSKSPARARPDRKRVGPLRQRAEATALPVEHVYLAHSPVGIRVKLDFGLARASCGVIWNIDDPGGAADTECCGRRGNRHIAVLGHQAGNERDCAARNVECGTVAFSALLIDEIIDDDARICGEAESSLVVEGNAEG